ncbi:hypothetical protein [Ornithinibacillus xuwenensis]|jgi:ketopantoate reductase|uniref:Uncharacterized protein n=1 Tax=Ornithinibacillus xuwenensis TaxID=3144668 RepID=A0ABU9XE77_9BACI
MKTKYVISAMGAGVVGYLVGANLMKKKEKDKHDEEGSTLYNAGKPDQVETLELDQLENAKMVSEGSQFGVQYYNNVKEEE